MPNLRPALARHTGLAIALTLIVGLSAHDAGAAKKKSAAAKKPVAAAVNACGDFYGFANQSWLAANKPDDSTGMVSALGQLQALAQQQQRDLLNAAMTSPQGNVQKLLGDFWASGLDQAALEADGGKPIAPLLARIDGIKRAKDIPPAIAALHQVGIPVAFNFTADVDLADLDRYIGYFAQGGLGLPDPAYYTRSDTDTRALLARYGSYVKQILALTGTPENKLATQVQQVIDLETRIAQASRPLSSLRDPRANFAPVTADALAKRYKRLQLGDFLKAQGVQDPRMSLVNAPLFAQLDALVGSLKPEQWQAYLRFQVGNAMAPYLSKSFRDAEFEFGGRVLRGENAQASREQQVLNAINQAAGPMLGHEYVARYLPAASAARAQDIAGQLRDALDRGIDRTAWMGEITKVQAKAKLGRLKIEIGAPRHDLDYSVQPMGRGSFGSNMLIASTWRHREEMKRIGQDNADRRWDVLPQQPALAYDIAQNRLIVTAAVLQAPVLDMSADAASQYGAFGAMVGHELSRSIDSKGRLVDATGQVKTWWTAVDDDAWAALTDTLVTQYGGYAYPRLDGVKVNGAQTRDENAADLAGVELAWDALNAAQPQLAAPARQAFFRGWAQLWRQEMSRDYAARNAATDVHAPGQWRVNGVLANLPAFAATHGCKAGSAMQRKPEQQVAIWR